MHGDACKRQAANRTIYQRLTVSELESLRETQRMNNNEDLRGQRGGFPLRGKTVLVTRARAQSAEITTQLEALGANVIHCPTIEVAPPASWAALDASIQRLAEYDWLVFTSANGVEFFSKRLRDKASGGIATLTTPIICAIGPATARALEAAGAVTTVVPSDSRAEGALTAIIDYVGGAQRVRGLSFLIPRARVARDVLPDGLRTLGARVDAVETYQTIRPNVEPDTILRLFNENTIDAITFTSSSTVSNFSAIVGLDDLSGLLANTIAVCIGPVTAETAESHRIEKIVHPSVYNTDALVDSIVNAIGRSWEVLARLSYLVCSAILFVQRVQEAKSSVQSWIRGEKKSSRELWCLHLAFW
jgi:uroporphyrinogen III methyltransferase/synthase